MKLVGIFLGVIFGVVALIWAIFPIVYIEKSNFKIPFFLGAFAALGYYVSGFFLYRTHKDKIIAFVKKYCN